MPATAASPQRRSQLAAQRRGVRHVGASRRVLCAARWDRRVLLLLRERGLEAGARDLVGLTRVAQEEGERLVRPNAALVVVYSHLDAIYYVLVLSGGRLGVVQ